MKKQKETITEHIQVAKKIFDKSKFKYDLNVLGTCYLLFPPKKKKVGLNGRPKECNNLHITMPKTQKNDKRNARL